MSDILRVEINPEDFELASTAPVIAQDRRVSENDMGISNQAPEIGWGDNFDVFARGLARYAIDPSFLDKGSFAATPVEDFLKWDGADAFLKENAEFLAGFERHFAASDIYEALRARVAQYLYEARKTQDWNTADAKQALLETAVPHPDGFKAVWLRGAEESRQPLAELASLLFEAGYNKNTGH